MAVHETQQQALHAYAAPAALRAAQRAAFYGVLGSQNRQLRTPEAIQWLLKSSRILIQPSKVDGVLQMSDRVKDMFLSRQGMR
jgi:hypothetical protein